MRVVRAVGLLLAITLSLSTIMVAEATAPVEFKTDYIQTFPESKNTPSPNEIFELVNKQRLENGLKPLKRSESLTELAQLRAQDMRQNQYYAHQSPEGLYFSDQMKFDGYACENLNLQFTNQAERPVSDWLRSKAGHKECLLNQQTNAAGYAAVEIIPEGGEDVPTYIIVAIHAE